MTPEANGEVEKTIFALLKQFGDTRPNMRYLDIGTRWGGYVQWPIESRGSTRCQVAYSAAMNSSHRVACSVSVVACP